MGTCEALGYSSRCPKGWVDAPKGMASGGRAHDREKGRWNKACEDPMTQEGGNKRRQAIKGARSTVQLNLNFKHASGQPTCIL